MPQATCPFVVLQERQRKQICQIALKMETCLPAWVAVSFPERGKIAGVKQLFGAELSNRCSCVELGCVCSLVWVHSARIPFPVLEPSPGRGFASVTLCSGLVCEQQVLNIAFCKE